MRKFKLIRHYLIQVLAMWQTNVLVKHQAMNDGQYTIHPVNRQKNNPAEIFGKDNQFSYQEKNDKGDTYRTHIARKTFRLLAEIEETEDKDGTDNRINKILLNKRERFPD